MAPSFKRGLPFFSPYDPVVKRLDRRTALSTDLRKPIKTSLEAWADSDNSFTIGVGKVYRTFRVETNPEFS